MYPICLPIKAFTLVTCEHSDVLRACMARFISIWSTSKNIFLAIFMISCFPRRHLLLESGISQIDIWCERFCGLFCWQDLFFHVCCTGSILTSCCVGKWKASFGYILVPKLQWMFDLKSLQRGSTYLLFQSKIWIPVSIQKRADFLQMITEGVAQPYFNLCDLVLSKKGGVFLINGWNSASQDYSVGKMALGVGKVTLQSWSKSSTTNTGIEKNSQLTSDWNIWHKVGSIP